MQDEKFQRLMTAKRALEAAEREHPKCRKLRVFHHIANELLLDWCDELQMSDEQVELLGGGTNKDEEE